MADKIACPLCGKLNDKNSAFCEKCGKDLVISDNISANFGEQAGTMKLSMPLSEEDSGNTEGKEMARTQRIKVLDENISTAGGMPYTTTYCPDLRIEYNMASFFVVGMSMPFSFRITPLVEKLDNIIISVNSEIDGKEWHNIKSLTHKPVKGKSFEHRINFKPGDTYGVISFEIYIAYQKEGKNYSFEAATRHKVYPQNGKAKDVLETIIVNINNEINTGHAADVNVRNGLDQFDSILRNTDKDDTIINLINRGYDFPPAMCILPLYPSNWIPPSNHALQEGRKETIIKAPDNITICLNNNMYIHLLAKEYCSLGKKRENDIVTRIFDPHGKPASELNAKISRFHCRIELHGDSCFIKDGGFYPDEGIERASSCGTYVNGEKIAPRDSIKLKTNIVSKLCLAGENEELSGVFAMDMIPVICHTPSKNCSMAINCTPGILSSIILKRKDHIPECFVILARCIDMGMVHPLLKGMEVWKGNGVFQFSIGAKHGMLLEENKITCGTTKLVVQKFKQWGL